MLYPRQRAPARGTHQVEFLERDRAVCLGRSLAGQCPVAAGPLPSPPRRPSVGPFSSVASRTPGPALPVGHARRPGPAAHRAGKGAEQHRTQELARRAPRAGGRRTSAQSRSESLGFVVALSPCLLLPGFPPSQTHSSGRRQEPRMPRQCEAALCARPRRDCGSLLLSKAEAPAQRGWLRVPPPWPWGQDCSVAQWSSPWPKQAKLR